MPPKLNSAKPELALSLGPHVETGFYNFECLICEMYECIFTVSSVFYFVLVRTFDFEAEIWFIRLV